MNKYVLPLVIAIGLVIIVGYSNFNKTKNQQIEKTVSASTSTTISQVKTQAISQNPTNAVSLPTGKDIIRIFFNLINEKRISEAIDMMTQNLTGNDSSKQAWGVQFNNIDSIALKTTEPAMQETWTQNQQEYKVVLDIKMNPKSADAPIPYYGWDNGENIRWVTIEKLGNFWKISVLATGP